VCVCVSFWVNPGILEVASLWVYTYRSAVAHFATVCAASRLPHPVKHKLIHQSNAALRRQMCTGSLDTLP
jgi:hypothetical protein